MTFSFESVFKTVRCDEHKGTAVGPLQTKKKSGHQSSGSGTMRDRQRDDLQSLASFESDDVSATSSVKTGSFPDPESRKDESYDEMVPIAKSETKAVLCIRVIVILVLVASTITVAVVVFNYTSGYENNEFEENFHESAQKIFEAFGTTLSETMGAVDVLAVNIVSHARSANLSWPFVTFPSYPVVASKLLTQTNAFVVSLYPLVEASERERWQSFSVSNEGWVNKTIDVQSKNKNYHGLIITNWTRSEEIYSNAGPILEEGPFLPTWLTAPVVPMGPPYNWDLYTPEYLRPSVLPVLNTKRVVIGATLNIPEPSNRTVTWAKGFLSPGEDATEPTTALYYPVVSGSDASVNIDVQISQEDQPVVGVIAISLFWREIIKDLLPPGSNGNVAVIENDCNQSFTYQINGPEVIYLGHGDRHDTKYNKYERVAKLEELDAFSVGNKTYSGAQLSTEFCPYWIKLYPSSTMEDIYRTSNPAIFTSVAVLIFAFTTMVFLLYDCLVERRQRKVLSAAIKSSNIVSSMFPSVVRDRVFKNSEDEEEQKSLKWNFRKQVDGHSSGAKKVPEHVESRPIADLFPQCTVMFADISGFTAWSSMREPEQVFTLLEAIYGAFDHLASRRGVYKVETIGDTYVAVAGLPNPCKDHAVVMARFADNCRSKMNEITRGLEVVLGPDTAELAMRFGLHSGPVTAGVLRGERSRFQLFGDTVNTAARMESNGIKNKIQASKATADLLLAAGKCNWVAPREDLIQAKGKGIMRTYWIEPRAGASSGSNSDGFSSLYQGETNDTDAKGILDDKAERLVDWMTDVLARILRDIVIHRRVASSSSPRAEHIQFELSPVSPYAAIIDEVADVIEFNAMRGENHDDQPSTGESPQVDLLVLKQLRRFVTIIAQLHTKRNSFHNFEHASHMTMSLTKLLSRMSSAELHHVKQSPSDHEDTAHSIHTQLDPFVQFACVFACLVHDVDHPGVSNAQLVQENARIATVYKGKSVAEQNAGDISWRVFTEGDFGELREMICPTDQEMKRFRQIVVNAVMATDIMDQRLNIWRDDRWKEAFSEHAPGSARDIANRKATVVIECIIQASDIAHTMQHWNIFKTWNERLFQETHSAYREGRADSDPTLTWYHEELRFFDNYVIPLAKKLGECGLFGGGSAELLNYALKNREEWEGKGEEIVAEMAQKCIGSNIGLSEENAEQFSSDKFC